MSSIGLTLALDDKRYTGVARLALLAIGDCGGVVSDEAIAMWCNVSIEAAQGLVINLIEDGVLVRDFSGQLCAPAFMDEHKAVKRYEVSVDTRKHVYGRDGNRCRYCGDEAGPFHLDHVFPRSRGGSNEAGNLVVACAKCNIRKRTRTPEEMGWSL